MQVLKHVNNGILHSLLKAVVHHWLFKCWKILLIAINMSKEYGITATVISGISAEPLSNRISDINNISICTIYKRESCNLWSSCYHISKDYAMGTQGLHKSRYRVILERLLLVFVSGWFFEVEIFLHVISFFIFLNVCYWNHNLF